MNKQEVINLIKGTEYATFILPGVGETTIPTIELKPMVKAWEHQLTNGWIPVSERLPELPDGRSFMNLNATILAPSGLRNAVPLTWELKRGEPTWCYLGLKTDWNVIAWQPLPESYKEVSDAERN